jgi:DNA-binding CsgD family transcriptional regulator
MSTLTHAARRTPAKPVGIPPDKSYPEPTACLESLIRQLAAHAQFASDDSTYTADDTKARVLIDTEVDGVRCLLVRKRERGMSQISFSPREREIGRMVAVGHPNKMIAAVLEISSWTVCTHLRRMFAKLGVSSRAAMVARMMEQGGWGSELTDEPRVRTGASKKPLGLLKPK